MNIDLDNLLSSILGSIDEMDYIKPREIPGIDLYMDQVLTLMESKLRNSTRYPDTDKLLTKTMINNYAKEDILPPPVKKKYTKEHVLYLLFIYYYKGILSLDDIKTLFQPIGEKYFGREDGLSMEEIYDEVWKIEFAQMEQMKKDIIRKYDKAESSFAKYEEEDTDYLKKFALVCELCFDVYVKKLIAEKMIDEMREEYGISGKADKGKVPAAEAEAPGKAERKESKREEKRKEKELNS